MLRAAAIAALTRGSTRPANFVGGERIFDDAQHVLLLFARELTRSDLAQLADGRRRAPVSAAPSKCSTVTPRISASRAS